MGKLLIPFAVLLAIIVGAMALDRPLPAADFSFLNRGNVKTLDPQRMSWMQDLRVCRLMFEGLVINDVFTEGYDPVPGVAESWEIERPVEVVDGVEFTRERYTFHLRDNARWSNGEPVKAGDFVYAWRRAILPDTAADYSGLFMLIQGAQEFAAWRTKATADFARTKADLVKDAPADERDARIAQAARELWNETERRFNEVVKVQAVDDRTLVVQLSEPTPFFLDLCAFCPFFPVYPPLVSRYEQLDPSTGMIKMEPGWTKPPHVVSNGVFMLTRWRYMRDLRFERNPHYWNPDIATVDTVSIPTLDDPNGQVLAFETGVVGWVSDCNVPYRVEMLRKKRDFYEEHSETVAALEAMGLDQFEIDRRLPDDPRKNIHAVPAFGTYWYNFNCLPKLHDGRPNPFHDRRVRKAFALMIDKQSICDNVQRIGNPVRRTIIPPNSIAGYESPVGIPCLSDCKTPQERAALVAQAKALLAEAGYANVASFPEVEILFNKDAGHDLIAQAVARDWQENLGVKVRLVQKEIAIVADDLKAKNYMVSRAGWYGDYGDPTTFLDVNRTGDGNNDRAYSNPVYDELLDRARKETDPVKRMDLLEEAERITVEDDMPLVPIFGYVNVYLFDPDEVGGISPHPRSEQNMYLIDLLKDGRGPDRGRIMRHSASEAPYAPATLGGER